MAQRLTSRWTPPGSATWAAGHHADIAEVVHTQLNQEATMLVIEWWTPAHGLRRIERE